ncbi:MAG: tryptophan synthase subunit alpha [Coriobacteriales bacterium]|nr:tryptophan synthase subunit alpha [Coriobacteriales bacterium]
MSAAPRGLARAFSAGHPALVVYLMAGYPDREGSLAALTAAAEAGADLIELGVPYTDAIADGPVIRRAGEAARDAAGGTFGLAETLDLAAEFIERSGESAPPVAVMTYTNPVMRMGWAEAARRMADAGVSGAILPDLPPDSPAAQEWTAAAREAGVDTVYLVAPTSTEDRLRTVAEASRGFVYCVSTTGVTGERESLPTEVPELVERTRAALAAAGSPDLPIAVGFGVSTPEQAAEIARVADGVVVGSACVKRQDDPSQLAGFVGKVADSVTSVTGNGVSA